jgi:Ca2+-binding EF-hand superfamily protein
LGIASLSLLAETSHVSAGPTARMTFAEFDTDGDGAVTPDEFNNVMAGWDAEPMQDPDMFALPAVCEGVFDEDDDDEATDAALFAEYDLDGNGTVSFAEVKIATEAQLTMEFHETDANGDGLLSLDELTDEPLTVAELAEFEVPTACAEELVAQDAELRAEFEDESFGSAEQRIVFAGLDANLDGHITMSEYLANN